MSDNGRVNVTINGTTVEAEEGRVLIDVAEEMGVFVPRFCYHPGMRSVAVCRMCLVSIEGQKKLMPACATPVADGMSVNTVDPEAVDAQSGVLELLLINHPLDCPICDRAGECPLQDQTFRHGPGSSRYVETKRTFEKPIEISDLVVLDRERCVLCWRCVRFADEVAGDQFIQLVDRGAGTQILTFKEDPFDSYFSGNTIQICPVGALLAKPYRFVSRPWNLKTAPTVCAYCSVGCPMTNEARSEKLVRCQALPNENVNDFWICDKGRFGYHYVDSGERLSSPLVRRETQQFELVSWGEALQTVAENLQSPRRVGVVAGGHLTTEDAFAISKLAKQVVGTPHVDSRIQDSGAPYELALQAGPVAGSTATINDLETASTIVWIGPDPKETVPVLFLRLRAAALDHDASVAVVSPRRISLDLFADHIIRCEAGGEASAVADLASGSAVDFGDRPVVCWSPSSPGRDERAIFSAAVSLARKIGAKLLVCPPHAGSQGLIDMGVYPTLDAGYVPAEEPGMDTRAMLEAAAAGELDALLVFGADLITDFPDAKLAQRALSSNVFTVVIELLPTETVSYADVVLPSTAYSERAGTFTNLERRLQKLEPLTIRPGSASEPWEICARLARAMGDDWGWRHMEDVWKSINREVATHAEVDIVELSQPAPAPHPAQQIGFTGEMDMTSPALAGPGGQYPKGHRAGAPFQTGYNWPLSWELRAFEARQRPGLIPSSNGGASDSRGRHASSPEGGAPSVSSPREGDYVLYTGRLIYDEGAMVSRSAALRGLARRPFVEMNEQDAATLGLAGGDEALVATDGFEASVEVVIADIAPGAVFLPYHQEGLRANQLIGGISPTVSVKKKQ